MHGREHRAFNDRLDELGYPVKLIDRDATILDVFLWHALEESEHKAVAFDVYRAVGASERLRIWTGRLMRLGFVFFVPGVVLLTLADRATYRPGSFRRSLRSLRRTPLLSRAMWRALKEFAEWRERLFGAEGRLNDRLAAA